MCTTKQSLVKNFQKKKKKKIVLQNLHLGWHAFCNQQFLFNFRKHTLNCHRMKPALFSVLCEIKEKTGKTMSISFSEYFLYLPFRKHAINCHRMKPALYSILCEIKEKTSKILK